MWVYECMVLNSMQKLAGWDRSALTGDTKEGVEVSKALTIQASYAMVRTMDFLESAKENGFMILSEGMTIWFIIFNGIFAVCVEKSFLGG